MKLSDAIMYIRLRLPGSMRYSDFNQMTSSTAQQRFANQLNNYITAAPRKDWEYERALMANAKCDGVNNFDVFLEIYRQVKPPNSYIAHRLFIENMHIENVEILDELWGNLGEFREVSVIRALDILIQKHNISHSSSFAIKFIQDVHSNKLTHLLRPKLLLNIYRAQTKPERLILAPIIQDVLDNKYFIDAKDIRHNLRLTLLDLAQEDGDMMKAAKILVSFPREEFVARKVCEKLLRDLLTEKRHLCLALLTALRQHEGLDIVPPFLVEELFQKTVHLDNISIFESCLMDMEPNSKYLPIFTHIQNYETKFYFNISSNAKIKKPLISGKTFSFDDHEAINKLGHPLSSAIKRDQQTEHKSEVDYELHEDVYLYGFSFGFVILNADLSPSGFHTPYLTENQLEKIRLLRTSAKDIDELAFIGDNFRPNNYAHFVLDYLPRILSLKHILRKASMKYGSFRLEGTKFQKQFFSLLDISENSQINLQHHSLYKVKILHTLTSSGQNFIHCFQGGLKDYAAPVYNLTKLPAIAMQSTEQASPRIALLRGPGSGGRNFQNEAEVHHWLKRNRFSLVDPAQISVKEQIKIMSQAECVFGTHGAALANAVFCKSGTQLIEVFPPYFGTRAFSTLAHARGLDYHAIIGNSEEAALSYPAVGWQDFYLPIDTLEGLELK